MAVIDLGSNSWRLVVYMFIPGDWWKLTDEIYETVRIGAGLAETGRLGDAAMGRGLETLAVFERFWPRTASVLTPSTRSPPARSATPPTARCSSRPPAPPAA